MVMVEDPNYMVIEKEHLCDLVTEANKWRDKGYKFVGAAIPYAFGARRYYVQTLVKSSAHLA